MNFNKISFILFTFSLMVISCSTPKNIAKSDGEIIGQKSCLPTRDIEELLEGKVELLAFFPWDNKEDIIPPSVIGGLDSLISRVRYNAIARFGKVSGPVICEFTITKEGKAINITIVKTIGAFCDEAVNEAIDLTKYIPAKKNGKNIDQLMRASFNFVLIKKKS